MNPPLPVSFPSSSSQIWYLSECPDHPLGYSSQETGCHSELLSSFNQSSSSVNSVSRLSLKSVPFFCLHFLQDVSTFWSVYLPIWIISTSLCLIFLLPGFMYSVLSPECSSKMKNLVISFQTYHCPFQWLPIDLQVKPEHLSLVCKTFHDLTPGNLSSWSITMSYLTFHHYSRWASCETQSSQCIVLPLTRTALFKSCTVERGLMKLKRRGQNPKRKLRREFQNRIGGSWVSNAAERASK